MIREGKERAALEQAKAALPKIRVAAGYEVPREYPACKHVAS